jgi:hypothetical protein
MQTVNVEFAIIEPTIPVLVAFLEHRFLFFRLPGNDRDHSDPDYKGNA